MAATRGSDISTIFNYISFGAKVEVAPPNRVCAGCHASVSTGVEGVPGAN